ncbi:MAG: 30S ribosomal protein S20 [Novibacillus thermophilus]|jgi:small subunit ribosomal protein S20|uniref:Small ribosomal subunit protein bS20 n=1 Tax=Novibacillus thermophilus TaxID=1471761 RepID=A0A1U9K5N4_9BACL|nr:30S ribosomal protein S20 [Novibacillus thermophilus]AQS55332.1 30S ribosomal protein S20 [Novibacillus thermophilus]
MPNIKSAVKRAKTSEKRRALRASQKSALRTAIKKFEQTVANASSEEAQAAYSQVQKKLDKAVTKGLLHKNAARRQKSRLAKKIHNA